MRLSSIYKATIIVDLLSAARRFLFLIITEIILVITSISANAADGVLLLNEIDSALGPMPFLKGMSPRENAAIENIKMSRSRGNIVAISSISGVALDSKVISVQIPFLSINLSVAGNPGFDEATKTKHWIGKAADGSAFNFAEDDLGGYGILRTGNRTFEFQALPGKFRTL